MLRKLISLALLAVLGVVCDDIGTQNGYTTLSTKNWDALLVKDSGTLASLKPKGSSFDFMPLDYLKAGYLAHNQVQHWGDIQMRFRDAGSNSAWTDGWSAVVRTPVTPVNTGALFASNMAPTMNTGPFTITREWTDIDGDLGMIFTLKHTGSKATELGGLGFAASINNIFNGRNTATMYQTCSLMDPYIGMDAGYVQATPISGVGQALVVTPQEDAHLEAYRWLGQPNIKPINIATNGWEGFYEFQVFGQAYAAKEWKNTKPWNAPTGTIIQPGQVRKYGVRFSVSPDIRSIPATVREAGKPTAVGVPGFIVPRDSLAKLHLSSNTDVSSFSVDPPEALTWTDSGNKTFDITAGSSTWGRVRLTVQYQDGMNQTIHYYITKSASDAISDLGHFTSTKQWFTDTTDPFGRAPSIMSYDYQAGAIITQEDRVWIAGLSDEGGAGSYVAAAMKQSFMPNADEISKLEQFIDKVLFKTVQNQQYGVVRSAFYYDKAAQPKYSYSSSYNWGSWTSFNKPYAATIDRAYNYVWPAATYWSLYRAGRAYPSLVKSHNWQWYLNQAYQTTLRGLQPDVGFYNVGLMGETVYGEILIALIQEGMTSQATQLSNVLKSRAVNWSTEQYPFGSEQAWDCTGQEGVYYWSRYFGLDAMKTKAMSSVLGYMPTVAHWGYNGNARRYWDFHVAGKVRTNERQIHHYGSGLNALIMLSAFKDNPTDSHLLRVGYGGISGPLSNINQDGFASVAMHARPENLFWDAYSGDYGPNFLGLALGSGSYLVDEPEMGMVAYGGVVRNSTGNVVTVEPRDPVKQKVFVAPLGWEIKIDAGIIQSFTYDSVAKTVSVTIGQLPGGTIASSTVVWVSRGGGATAASPGGTAAKVSAGDQKVVASRGGVAVALSSGSVTVNVGV